MITRRMKIRRQLRSVRTSSLSEAERRQELREAEARHEHAQDRDEAATPSAPPRAAGEGDASRLREARAARAGVDETD
jgi:hypothetical protein